MSQKPSQATPIAHLAHVYGRQVKPDRNPSRLFAAIGKAGFRSVMDFSNQHAIPYATLLRLGQGEASPVDQNGLYRPEVLRLCGLLNLAPLDIFDEDQIDPPLDLQGHLAIEPGQADDIFGRTLSPDDHASQAQHVDLTQRVLDSLTLRESRVLRDHLGWDGAAPKTLGQIAEDLNVSPGRIRGIAAKALRKLRHPSRADLLRNFLDDTSQPESPNPLRHLVSPDAAGSRRSHLLPAETGTRPAPGHQSTIDTNKVLQDLQSTEIEVARTAATWLSSCDLTAAHIGLISAAVLNQDREISDMASMTLNSLGSIMTEAVGDAFKQDTILMDCMLSWYRRQVNDPVAKQRLDAAPGTLHLALVTALQNGPQPTSTRAAQIVLDLGASAKPLLPVLVSQLREGGAAGYRAASIFARLGAHAGSTIRELLARAAATSVRAQHANKELAAHCAKAALHLLQNPANASYGQRLTPDQFRSIDKWLPGARGAVAAIRKSFAARPGMTM